LTETEPLAPADAGREGLPLDAGAWSAPPSRLLGAAAACAWSALQSALMAGTEIISGAGKDQDART